MHNLVYSYNCDCGHSHQGRASWEIKYLGDEVEELLIREGDSVFDVVIGTWCRGEFLCIPQHGVGCPLSGPPVVLSVIDYLSRVLGSREASAIAYALRDYFDTPSGIRCSGYDD